MKPTTLATTLLFAALTAPPLLAQTGPGGIGSTDGTSNLQIWLDAEEITGISSGSSTGTWNDLSGHANNATQVTGANQPAYQTNVINGRPVLRFDGSNDQLVLPKVIGDDFTIVAVFRSNDGGTGTGNTQWHQGSGIVDAEVSTVVNDFGTSLGKDGQVLSGIGNPDKSVISASGFDDGSTHFYAFWRYKNAGIIAQTVDATGGMVGGTGTQSLGSPTRIVIGSLQSNTNYLNGDVAEVIIYDKPLNYAESTILGNYLSAKYNISIGAYDRYANSTYILDVAGIGRESDGNILTDGLVDEAHSAGFIARDNNPAGPMFLIGDNAYLLFGHNSVTNGWTSSDVPASVPARWIRDWYLDRTGANGADNLTIGFDFSEGGISGTPGSPSNYHLLYRASPGDAWTIYSGDPTPSITGDQLIFTVSAGDIVDGYYTLGGPASDTRLPVELVDFNARYNGHQALINWRTASEVNNGGFVISRSQGDTSNFEMIASYLTDPGLTGQGTTSRGHNYQYTDADYLEPGTTCYYRIRDVGVDGAIGSLERTAVVSIPALTLPPATAAGYRLGQNIPNPARSLTRIPFSTPTAEQVRLTLYNDKGIELANYTVQVSEGMNTIDLNISTLPAGNYLYQIITEETTLSRIMTVVR